MEGQHQGMDRSVTVAAVAHCRQQKSMGYFTTEACIRLPTTLGRHGNFVKLLNILLISEHLTGLLDIMHCLVGSAYVSHSLQAPRLITAKATSAA